MISIKFSSFGEPDTNGIFLDNDITTTQEIQNQINNTRRIILVTEPKSKHHYHSITDLNSFSIYEIIRDNKLTNKIMISVDKFIFMIKFGLIDGQKFQAVVLRLEELKKPLATSFKYFFLNDPDEKFEIVRKLRVSCYFKKISENDAIFIGSRNRQITPPSFYAIGDDCSFYKRSVIFNDPDTQEQIVACNNDTYFARRIEECVFSLFIVEPAFTPLINTYIQTKMNLEAMALKSEIPEMIELLERVDEIETVSFKYALKTMKAKLRVDENRSSEIIDSYGAEKVKWLLINQMKYEKFKEFIENNSEKIFVVSNNELLLQSFSGTSDQLIDAKKCSESHFHEMSHESILFFYDENLIELAKYPFKKVVVYKEKENDFSFFFDVRETRSSLNRDYNFMKFIRDSEPCIKQNNARITLSSAYQMLINYFYILKNKFDDNFLFIKDIKIKNSYEQSNLEFVCCIQLPHLHDHPIFTESFRSQKAISKKVAQNELALKIFKELCLNGFCDDNFLPTEIFIKNNLVYDAFLQDIYGTCDIGEIQKIRDTFAAEKLKNPAIHENCINSLFTKQYPAFINNESEGTTKKEIAAKLHSTTLSSYTKNFFVFVFNQGTEDDWDVGVCCGPTFNENVDMSGIRIESKKENVKIDGVKIDYLYETEFSNEEIDLLIFFQVIFFSLHFKNTLSNESASKSYCYFMVPILNGKIDFVFLNELANNFLKENVYSQTTDYFKDNLLFNPVSKFFYVFCKNMNVSINDKIVAARDGNISYADFFEEKYGIILSIISDDPRLLFKGLIYTGRPTCTAATVLSSEIVHVTSIPKDIYKKHFLFVSFFSVFESACLAYDMKKSLNLKIPVDKTMVCLSGRKGVPEFDYEYCYERYEFLGDAILKYAATKHLFISNVGTLNEMVSKKDAFVSNENLCKIAYRLEIPKYYTQISFSDKTFQPPNINLFIDSVEDGTSLKEYISYFKAEKVFNSNRQEKYLCAIKNKTTEVEVQTRKVFADIVEAIIGQYYLHLGLQAATDFIYEIQILPKMELNPPIYKLYNLVSAEEIEEVEKKIGYEFKDKALLERFVVHPSKPSAIDPEEFQTLEMLGDSMLDLLVTTYIFNTYELTDPFALHEKRKSLVNNFSLARVLFETELYKNIKHCFTAEYIDTLKNKICDDGSKVNKMFGDIVEAVFGAVYVDCGFDVDKFLEFGKQHLHVLEKCKDVTR